MPSTKAQIEASKRYHAKHDEIRIRVSKGEKKKIQDFAKSKGMSMNTFIYNLIKESMTDQFQISDK